MQQPAFGHFQHPQAGAEEDADIEPRSGRANVLAVEGQFAADAVQIGVGREIQLRQPRDARWNDEPLVIAGNRFGQDVNELRPLGPRTDDRHFALDDVQQLRNFVQMELPQHPAYGRDPRVVGRLGPDGTGAGLGIVTHGADLVHLELAAVAADANLAIDAGTAGGQADQETSNAIRGKPGASKKRRQPGQKPLSSENMPAETAYRSPLFAVPSPARNDGVAGNSFRLFDRHGSIPPHKRSIAV